MTIESPDRPDTTAPSVPTSKADRYETERFGGAQDLNWYLCDPALQRTLRFHMQPKDFEWVQPYLEEWGALMSGTVESCAQETDRNPPHLIKYDRWGHDVSEVVIPDSVRRSKDAIISTRLSSRKAVEAARAAGVRTEGAGLAESYMLNQADIGMACALGTGGAMVQRLVEQFAPPDVRDFVMGKFASGEWTGETAQMFTERSGGSDLGAIETTATPDGDAWRLNGVKWFASNANGEIAVVLAKPEGAPDNVKGVCSFLVMRKRRDGSPNGVHIRRLKDKLGTRTVASCEIEFIDAEAFLMSGAPSSDGGAGDGQGLTRMMQMTNDARIGVATMGLGAARRALVESISYANVRSAFGDRLINHPLMKRKLVEMIVDLEAGLAMLFDGSGLTNQQRASGASGRGQARLRIAPAIIKLKAARLGITMASDAIEVHGGNGYIETWPVARILRDAQVNTIWEGPDNILCLDVRRSIEREQADGPLLERLREAVSNAGETVAARVVAGRIDDLEQAIDAWKALDREPAEARLFPLAQFMGDVYAGALLAEQAEWERAEYGDTRKELIAQLYVERYLADRSPLRGIDAKSAPDLERFDEILAGAFVDARRTS
jgi:alkylation response protein AidB-like acyl-CoA dehydrogenase